MAHYKDLLGSTLRLSTRSLRRQAASRRGVFTQAGNEPNQKDLADVAALVAAELGAYHPHATSLPLNEVSLRRIGADRVEYEATYGHAQDEQDNGYTAIDVEQGRPILVPFGSEVASGRRWTPNERPPLVPRQTTLMIIRRQFTSNSLSAVQNAMSAGGLVGLANNAALTVSGIVYPMNSLLYLGTEVRYDADQTSSVMITHRLAHRRYLSVDANPVAYYWHEPGYAAISSRPYWQAAFVPPPTGNLSVLAGL